MKFIRFVLYSDGIQNSSRIYFITHRRHRVSPYAILVSANVEKKPCSHRRTKIWREKIIIIISRNIYCSLIIFRFFLTAVSLMLCCCLFRRISRCNNSVWLRAGRLLLAVHRCHPLKCSPPSAFSKANGWQSKKWPRRRWVRNIL